MIRYIISIEEHNEEIAIGVERVEQDPTEAEERNAGLFAMFLKATTSRLQETLLRLAQAQGNSGKVDMYEGEAAGRMMERLRRGNGKEIH